MVLREGRMEGGEWSCEKEEEMEVGGLKRRKGEEGGWS